MDFKKVFLPGLLIAICSLPAIAQKVKLEPDQHYLLLATTKTSTMQDELDEVAAEGFRIIVGAPTSGSEMVLFLERVTKPPDTYKYKLLATSRTGTMEKELQEAAREGFRLLPRTMIAKTSVTKRSLLGGGPDIEIVAVLERTPKVDNHYQYRLLATTLTSTLQKEVTQALADGYVLVGMVSRDEHMVIMEKELPAKE
jgi:hypothetical protein